MVLARVIRLQFVVLVFALAQTCLAEVVGLSNGDRITGSIVSSTDAQLVLQTDFGTVTIPRSKVVSIAAQKDAQAGDAAPETAADNSSGGSSKGAAEEVAKSEPDPAAPEAKPRKIEWVEDYRGFIKNTLPEDFHMRLRGGVQYYQTSSKNFSVGLALDIVENFSEFQTFKSTLYYDYANERPEGGGDNVTVDKYGLDTSYRVDFDQTKHWYFNNILNYKVDMVRGIKNQVDEAATFGYRFDFDRYDLVIDIAPGPAVRYINAENYDTHWVAMAVLSEDLVWKFHSFMRLEQNIYTGFDLERPDNYTFNFKLALIMSVTEVMDIALRYSYIYDSINATEAQKSEQILTLSFEFPFNWKN